MRNHLYLMTATIILLTVCAPSQTKAQSITCKSLKATIPFQFNVGKTLLPADEYLITPTNCTSDQIILQFRSKKGRARTLVQMHTAIGEAADAARLIFNRYGTQHFFAQAWMPYDRHGVKATQSHAERSMQRELNITGQKRETVALKVEQRN